MRLPGSRVSWLWWPRVLPTQFAGFRMETGDVVAFARAVGQIIRLVDDDPTSTAAAGAAAPTLSLIAIPVMPNAKIY